MLPINDYGFEWSEEMENAFSTLTDKQRQVIRLMFFGYFKKREKEGKTYENFVVKSYNNIDNVGINGLEVKLNEALAPLTRVE